MGYWIAIFLGVVVLCLNKFLATKRVKYWQENFGIKFSIKRTSLIFIMGGCLLMFFGLLGVLGLIKNH
jgi:formate hydrogenlyase subunit 3/multisubunit Na+/H+ antiporter MnhD subunit